MSDRQQDADLLARFHAQRREDADAAPPFARLAARARAEAANASPAIAPRRRTWRHLVYAGGLAAAAAAAVVIIPRSPSSEDAFERAVRAFESDPALGAWRSPTSGLLHVAGSELMTTVPRLGGRSESR
jgi:hypothetical protein